MVWEGNKKKGNWADESSLIESSSWRKLVFDVLTDGLCNISVTVAPCNTGNRNDSRVHVCLSHHQGRTCLLQQRWTRQTERTQQDETQGSVWPSNLSETHHAFIERFCFTYTPLWILLVDKKKQQLMIIHWAKLAKSERWLWDINTVFSWGLDQALKLHSGVHLHPEEERHF